MQIKGSEVTVFTIGSGFFLWITIWSILRISS